MAAIGMLMVFMLFCAIACCGIAWRFIICRKRIVLLPWYFAHPIAILCGLLTAATYCLFILLTMRYTPPSFREVIGLTEVLILFALPVPISLFVGIKKGYFSKSQ